MPRPNSRHARSYVRSRTLPPEPSTVGVVVGVAVLTALLFVAYDGWQIAVAVLDGYMIRILVERRRQGQL